MEMIRIASGVIKAVGYDPDDLILDIEFQGGKIYRCENVPPEEFDAIMDADSIGSYIMDVIIQNYDNYEV